MVILQRSLTLLGATGLIVTAGCDTFGFDPSSVELIDDATTFVPTDSDFTVQDDADADDGSTAQGDASENDGSTPSDLADADGGLACTPSCTGDLVCRSGTCSCADPSASICDDRCIDTAVERTDCGGCGFACAGGCAGGLCDCSGQVTSLAIDAQNCGACGVSCEQPNTTASCVSGACTVVSCSVGWADCNSDGEDGCETELATSAVHCGACGATCAVGELCADAECQPTTAIRRLVSGLEHTCILRFDGSVACWGRNDAGQAGVPGFGPVSSATSLAGQPPEIVEIDATGQHTCVLTRSGEVWCWGADGEDQVGGGGDTAAPVRKPEIADAVDLAVGGEHTCVALADRTLSCWGRDDKGQLGPTGTQGPVPGAVPGLADVQAGESGAKFNCAAIGPTREVFCWGAGALGQLGDGSGTDSDTPVSTGLSGVDAWSFSTDTAGAVVGGQLYAWGANDEGQLTAAVGDQADSPTPLGIAADTVATGASHMCTALDGSVSCWGLGSAGQLGVGTEASSASPLAVALPAAARSLSAGLLHTCALLVDDRVFCWGDNAEGQLGRSGTARSTTPIEVALP